MAPNQSAAKNQMVTRSQRGTRKKAIAKNPEARVAAAEARAAEAEARAAAAEKALAEEQELINWAREKQKKKRQREELLAAEKRKEEEEERRWEAESRRWKAGKAFADGVFTYLKDLYEYYLRADVVTPMVGFVYIVPSSDSDAFTAASPPGRELCTGLACIVRREGTSVTALSCLGQAGDRGAAARAILVHYPLMELLIQAEAEVMREFGVALLKPTTEPTAQAPTCFKCNLLGVSSSPNWSYVFGRELSPTKENSQGWWDRFNGKSPPSITQDLRTGLRAFHVSNWAEAADESDRDHFFLCWDRGIRNTDAVGSPVWGSDGVCVGIVVALHKLPSAYVGDEAIEPFTCLTGHPFKYKSVKEIGRELFKRDLRALDGFMLTEPFSNSRTLVEVVSFQQLPFFRCPEKEWMDTHSVSNFMLDDHESREEAEPQHRLTVRTRRRVS